MSERLVLRRAARNDIRAAVDWYESQRDGLGDQFLAELDTSFERIVSNPEQFPRIEVDVRRSLLRRFPFGVYFLTSSAGIEVIAVLHLHRDPRVWKGRNRNGGFEG